MPTYEQTLDRPILHAGLVKRILSLLIGVAALSVSARLSFPHPFAATPVPVTCQVLVLLVLGLTQPPRTATATVSAYLALGLSGAPVFAWGVGGAVALFGPTGGYLLGFLPAVYVVAALRGRNPASLLHDAAAALAGLALIYAAGTAWLALWLGDLGTAWRAGGLPFAAPDALKLIVALAASVILRRGSHNA